MPGGGQKKKPQNQQNSQQQKTEVPNFDFLKNDPNTTGGQVVPASDQTEGKKAFDFSEIKNALGSEQVQGMFMDAIEKRLQNMVGKSSGFFTSLPKTVQQRVLALHNIHSQKVELDKQFEAEVKELEKKYALKFDPIFTKRTNIISGAIEADPADIEEGKKKRKEMMGNVIDEDELEKENKEEKEEDENIKGIPEFWLTCLRHCEATSELIEEKDEDALRYLENIKWKPLEEGKDSFVLQFYFAKNPYFNNAILEKTYHLMEDAEFGEVMYDRCEATPIEWKQGKNLTVKKVTKKQKPKANRGKRGGYGKGSRENQGKTVTIEEKVPSFFHFFSDPETMIDMYLSMVGDNDQNAPDPEVILENDYEVGLELKEKVVPNAVIFYTGMTGLKEEEEEDEYDEEGEEGESYHSSQDEDYDPRDDRLGKALQGKNLPPRGGGNKQQECNQQ